MKGETVRCPVPACKVRYNVNTAAAVSRHLDCQIIAAHLKARRTGADQRIDLDAVYASAYSEEMVDQMAGYPVSKHLVLYDVDTGRTRPLTRALRRLIARGLE